MTQRSRTATCAFLLTVLVAVSAQGEMVWDPPWVENPSDPQWTGGVVTHQRWEFAEDPGYPVDAINPFGQPYVDLGSVNSGNATYPDIVIGPDGVTEIPTWHINQDGGFLMIYVPNNPLPNARKVIFIQLTSDKGPLLGSPTSSPTGTVSYPKSAINHNGTGWYTYTAQIDLPFNPVEEYIFYTFPESTNISEVVVDTICVPEPATLGLLLCMAGLVALRRRYRQDA